MPYRPEFPPDSEPVVRSPFVEVRYSLPALMKEVIRDRSSAAFAMEKLDQPTINLLFESQRLRRDTHTSQ